jgi:hypothetical protein
MKEHVREGENGHVVPTGSREALRERMAHLRRHSLTRAHPDEMASSYPPNPTLS